MLKYAYCFMKCNIAMPVVSRRGDRLSTRPIIFIVARSHAFLKMNAHFKLSVLNLKLTLKRLEISKSYCYFVNIITEVIFKLLQQ